MTITELKVKLASLNSADKAAAIEFLLQTVSNDSLGILVGGQKPGFLPKY